MTPRAPRGPEHRSGRARTVLLIAASLVVAACAADGDVISITATQTPESADPIESSATSSDDSTTTTDATVPPTTAAPTVPTTTLAPIIEPELFASVPIGEVADVGENKPVRDYDDFVGVAFTDIERWWSEQYPEVYGEAFVPLAGGVYVGYPDRESPIPGCGEEETDYADLQLFVAFYCVQGDFMAYDDGSGEGEFGPSILAPLAEEYGSAVMGVVLAHEYGHAIQERIGALDRFLATIITEQQADCFAGAWTGQAFRGESPLLQLGDRDVRAGLLAMLNVRDPVGTDQFVPGGHGSAFDRVGAFQEGFLEGAAGCAPLLDDPLPLVPNEFRSLDDQERGGNASYDCRDDPDPDCTPAPEFLAADLNHFWATALGEFEPVAAVPVDDLTTVACAEPVALLEWVVSCPATRTVFFDEPEVRDLYFEFGDFTIGYFYGIGWAEFVQDQETTGLAGEPRSLLSDCYTGAWVSDITPDANNQTPRGGRDDNNDGVPEGVVSSPGDLDEAIQMAILVGDEGANIDVVGSSFEKIDAFRTGVLGGLTACAALGG